MNDVMKLDPADIDAAFKHEGWSAFVEWAARSAISIDKVAVWWPLWEAFSTGWHASTNGKW